MSPGRIRLTTYLGAISVLFLACGVLTVFLTSRPVRNEQRRNWTRALLVNLARSRDDPAQLAEELVVLADAGADASLYRPGGALIVTSVAPPLPIGEDGKESDRVFTHVMRVGGAVVAIGVLRVHEPPFYRALIPLGVMAAMLLLLVVVLVHYIGAPLQRIAAAARRFGGGELSARAAIRRSDELGEVGRAFDDMADRVTTLMTAQRELMANVSHELQTPLARIQVAVDLMLDGIDDRVKEILPEISHDLGEVERLIEDVMTLSRFDLAHTQGSPVGAPLRKQATLLSELVERAAMRFRTHHRDRLLVVCSTDDLPVLLVDPVLVRRVIENLLDNASKYSEPDTEIRVTAASTERAVTLEVVDRGIGIDPADLEQLFTPFFRTDRSRNRKTGGVGLGLVLARRVIEAHGGTIAVASEPGAGTTVRFELPVPSQGAVAPS